MIELHEGKHYYLYLDESGDFGDIDTDDNMNGSCSANLTKFLFKTLQQLT